MSRRIAVAILHGAGVHRTQEPTVEDPDTMLAMQLLIEKRFAERLSLGKGDSPLVFKRIYWDSGAVLQTRQDSLYNTMRRAGVRFDSIFKIRGYGTPREFLFHMIGDVAAYQPIRHPQIGAQVMAQQDTYVAVHSVVAQGLRELAQTAGPDAPLCIIAHSLGSVVVSNYIYDLQQEFVYQRHIIPNHVRKHIGDTPFEQGGTIACFFSMGSPLALWSLRYHTFDQPIRVPVWLNIYDKDDLLAYPLEPLMGRDYVRDCPVNAGGTFASATPLSHVAYWTDKDVIRIIADELFMVWHKMQRS